MSKLNYMFQDALDKMLNSKTTLDQRHLESQIMNMYREMTINGYSKRIRYEDDYSHPTETPQEKKQKRMKLLRSEIDSIARKINALDSSTMNPGGLTTEEFDFKKVLLIEALEDFFDATTKGEQVEPCHALEKTGQ